MTQNEKKNLYSEFEQEVRMHWNYHQNTTFSKMLSKTGAFGKYATKGLKDVDSFERSEMQDYNYMFKCYVSFLLNDGESEFRKSIVSNETVTNIFLSEKVINENKQKQCFIIVSDMNNDKVFYGNDISNIEKIKDGLRRFDSKILISSGVSPRLSRYIEDNLRITLADKHRNFDDEYKITVVHLKNLDYAFGLEKSNDIFDEVWGLPSIFIGTKFKANVNHEDGNEFRIKSSISNNGKRYIDIKGDNDFKSSKRIIVMPICVADLVAFVDGVKRDHGSIDSLFSLNVRDRKNTKNKVSMSIINSVIKHPGNFFMYNNGITAIVDDIVERSEAGDDFIKFKNIRIINGQQTTNTLYQYYVDKGKEIAEYNHAYVMLKAYQVNNGNQKQANELFNDISNATNSQNAIKAKDLMSTRPFNLKLQLKLLELGINYSFRDGESEFSRQLKSLPKITLNELVKMHYILISGEAWKRGSIGQVFDALVGFTNASSKPLKNYSTSFNEMGDEELADQLADIAILQLYFKGRKEELGKESQGLDLLIYLALKLKQNKYDPFTIDISKFVDIVSAELGSLDRNNAYKSAKPVQKMIDALFKEFNIK